MTELGPRTYWSLLRNSGSAVARLARAQARDDPSFAGEYAHLDELFRRLGLSSGWVVDMAASDGTTQSSTLEFFRDDSWSGLAVEMDPDRFARLSLTYAAFSGVRLARGRVTPVNVATLLEAFDTPKSFTLLNLDIDSYDLDVLESMLAAGFHPRVISMEINEKLPPPIHFRVKFSEDHLWKGDHFYGCSLAAAAAALEPFGYLLESLQYNNAMFVASEIGRDVVQPQAVEVAYDLGYRNRSNRAELFPWNHDVDCALSMSPDEGVAFFSELFAEHTGKFVLHS